MRRRDVLKGLLSFAAPVGLLTAGVATVVDRGWPTFPTGCAPGEMGGYPIVLGEPGSVVPRRAAEQMGVGVDHGAGSDEEACTIIRIAEHPIDAKTVRLFDWDWSAGRVVKLQKDERGTYVMFT